MKSLDNPSVIIKKPPLVFGSPDSNDTMGTNAFGIHQQSDAYTAGSGSPQGGGIGAGGASNRYGRPIFESDNKKEGSNVQKENEPDETHTISIYSIPYHLYG